MSKSNSWERATKMWLVKPRDKMCGICKKDPQVAASCLQGHLEGGEKGDRGVEHSCVNVNLRVTVKVLPIMFQNYVYFKVKLSFVYWASHSLSYCYVCPSSLRRWSTYLLVGLTDPYNHILKAYDESYSKIIREHKYKDKDYDKDSYNAKTKCLKYPAYALFLAVQDAWLPIV